MVAKNTKLYTGTRCCVLFYNGALLISVYIVSYWIIEYTVLPVTATMQNSTYDKGPDIYLRIIDEPVFWLVLAVLGFALSTVITVANFMVIATIYRDPKKSLRTPPCLLIANLGSSDLLVGLCVVSLVAFRDVYRSLQQQVPLPLSVGIFVTYVLCTTLFVSSATMIALSLTCFVAINSPMQYKTKITKKRASIFIIVIWVVSALICFLPATKVPEQTYLLIYIHTHISVPALFLMVIYAKGFRALARRRRELQHSGHTSDESNKRALERERNMAVTVIIILAIFYITYLPQFIMIHVTHFCSSCEISEDSITFHKVDVISSRFVFLNSALNPFVYAWRMPKYRQALNSCWKALKEKLRFRSQRVEVGPLFVFSRRNVRGSTTTVSTWLTLDGKTIVKLPLDERSTPKAYTKAAEKSAQKYVLVAECPAFLSNWLDLTLKFSELLQKSPRNADSIWALLICSNGIWVSPFISRHTILTSEPTS